jgi:hypothetical protein
MNNDTQDIDLNNEETTTYEAEETQSQEETVDWQAKARELEGRLKRAETKLKKSPETTTKAPSTSGEFDYGQKAFLKASGITTTDEMKLAKDYMSNTGKSLDEVVESKYFISELKEMRDLKSTEQAVVPGSKRVGQSASDSVDYWIAKDEMPPVGNDSLRREWVNAKMKKETNGGKFYNS